jgi:hypothetical protein
MVLTRRLKSNKIRQASTKHLHLWLGGVTIRYGAIQRRLPLWKVHPRNTDTARDTLRQSLQSKWLGWGEMGWENIIRCKPMYSVSGD